MGKVDINLSEYLNFDEPITTKYLLNDSKVNSILGVTIGLNELSSTFDFHTQLQIQDSNSSISGGSTSISNNTNSMLSRPTPQYHLEEIISMSHNLNGNMYLQVLVMF